MPRKKKEEKEKGQKECTERGGGGGGAWMSEHASTENAQFKDAWKRDGDTNHAS